MRLASAAPAGCIRGAGRYDDKHEDAKNLCCNAPVGAGMVHGVAGCRHRRTHRAPAAHPDHLLQHRHPHADDAERCRHRRENGQRGHGLPAVLPCGRATSRHYRHADPSAPPGPRAAAHRVGAHCRSHRRAASGARPPRALLTLAPPAHPLRPARGGRPACPRPAYRLAHPGQALRRHGVPPSHPSERVFMIRSAAPARVPALRAQTPSFTLSPLYASLLAGLAFAPLTATAQNPATDTPTLQSVQVVDTAPAPNGRLNLDTPVETGSRLGLSPRETPASVTVVDRATIEARGAQDTQEILRAIPGVTAHNAPGSIGVSYRGFGSGSIGQLFNGISVQYSIAARPVDSWIYDRVEAIGGPSSFLFGSGAVGGSINYITKTADRHDFTEGQLRLGQNNLKEVSLGLNRRIAGGDGTAGPQHFARIDLNHRDAGHWVDGMHTRSTQLATSLLSDLGGGLTHTLAYEYQNEHVDRPYWGTPLLNPVAGELRIDPRTRFANYNSADGLYAQRVQWLRSVTQWRASDALELRNTFYVYDALRDYRNVETYRFNASNSQVIRSAAFLQRHDHEVVGDRVEGTYKSSIAGHKSDWAFGLDVSVNRQTRFPNSGSGTVSTLDPYHFGTENFFDIPGMVPGFKPDRDNKVTTTALYLENRTAVAPKVNLITALRHERIDLDLTNRRAITAAMPATYSRGYSPTTGRIGVVWDIAPVANLYAQYSTAADPPSGILSTASFADVMNNSELTSGRQA